ncbi:hypothetical protein RHSIM_Rhsim11G0039000 [Rhododendron simsii]|uniref:Uncharacterized protein n=1 Tax=Rhododendron simsii TaxID=118357 RepID=A0A834GAG8_RHOSS|nr:hypothetical protein RHSIM_Rhsim11G0039000 [Rhododendron simsii]
MDAPGTSRIKARHSRRNHQQGPQVNITRDVTGSPAEVKKGVLCKNEGKLSAARNPSVLCKKEAKVSAACNPRCGGCTFAVGLNHIEWCTWFDAVQCNHRVHPRERNYCTFCCGKGNSYPQDSLPALHVCTLNARKCWTPTATKTQTRSADLSFYIRAI